MRVFELEVQIGRSMESLSKFSDYDYFGYISSGLASLGIWDIIFGTEHLLGATWNVPKAIVIVLVAYTIGQVIAAPSAWLIERRLVSRYLLRPSVWLLQTENGKTSMGMGKLLGDYHTPLPENIRQRVFARANTEGAEGLREEALFWHAFGQAKQDPHAYARMEVFLRLYGFCRNMAFVGLLGAMLALFKSIVEGIHLGWSEDLGRLAGSALLMGLLAIGMIHRYLKFFRLYSVEVFLSYASPVPEYLSRSMKDD